MKSNYKPLIVAVFLVFSGLISKSWYLKSADSSEIKGFLGDPSSANEHYSASLFGIAQAHGIENGNSAMIQVGGVVTAAVGAPVVHGLIYSDGIARDPGQPIGQFADLTKISQYKVKRGDTLSEIAAQFNISAAHILSANPNISKKSLKVGQIIIIPDAAGNTSLSKTASSLPNMNGYFIAPAGGYNTGVLNADNGIDIENSCGTSVVAAADGVVVPDPEISQTAGGWNAGYGNFVLIEHPFGNGIFTRYSHLESTLVQIGDYVKQGQQIGLIGQTGGAPNCELNFQVIGAKNPLGK
jgi:murein DD-endopeptidase MepM/ murein hydrolase activator NlpD